MTVGISNRTRKINVSGKSVRNPGRLPWPRNKIDESTGKIAVDKRGDPIALGVDVEKKRKDIIKIVHKFFRVPDITMDELLQEVFLAIIHKNHGKSAHDPTKSSFGHYVYMVANNVCVNLVHKKKRFEKEKDSLDAPQGREDNRTLLECTEAPIIEKNERFLNKLDEIEIVLRKQGEWNLARYVRAARSGSDSSVIREALSWGGKEITNKNMREMRNKLQMIVTDMFSSSLQARP